MDKREPAPRIATISQLAGRLRTEAVALQGRGEYDPKCHSVARIVTREMNEGWVGIETNNSLIGSLFPILTCALHDGAFSSAEDLMVFGDQIDSSSPVKSVLGVLRAMKTRGHDCYGVTVGCGSIERLADAFDALATTVRVSPSKDRADDCAWVRWGGTRFDFNRTQALIVRRLIEDHETGGSGITDVELCESAKVERIDSTFRKKSGRVPGFHEAWGKMIGPDKDRRGVIRYFSPTCSRK